MRSMPSHPAVAAVTTSTPASAAAHLLSTISTSAIVNVNGSGVAVGPRAAVPPRAQDLTLADPGRPPAIVPVIPGPLLATMHSGNDDVAAVTASTAKRRLRVVKKRKRPAGAKLPPRVIQERKEHAARPRSPTPSQRPTPSQLRPENRGVHSPEAKETPRDDRQSATPPARDITDELSLSQSTLRHFTFDFRAAATGSPSPDGASPTPSARPTPTPVSPDESLRITIPVSPRAPSGGQPPPPPKAASQSQSQPQSQSLIPSLVVTMRPTPPAPPLSQLINPLLTQPPRLRVEVSQSTPLASPLGKPSVAAGGAASGAGVSAGGGGVAPPAAAAATPVVVAAAAAASSSDDDDDDDEVPSSLPESQSTSVPSTQ